MDTSSTALVDQRTGGRTVKPSTANRVGYVLATLFGLSDTVSIANPTPDGQVGPPLVVLVALSVLGVVTLVGVWFGWARGSRAGIRTAAASRVLSLLLGLPVFFVDGLPGWLVAVSAVGTVLTIVCVVLMLQPPKEQSL